MSDFNDFDESSEEVQESRNPLRSRIKELESEIKSMRQQAAESEQAKRELAFVKAGIDTSDNAAKYFVKAYDGELTADAIKQAAVEARLLSPAPQNEEMQSEQQAWSRTNQVAAGAGSSFQVPDIETRIANATSEAEVLDILAEAQNQ
jgi:uncharacterized protein YigA (DUF484 family)